MMFLVIFVVFQVLVASILVFRKFLFDCLVLWSFLTVCCPLLHFEDLPGGNARFETHRPGTMFGIRLRRSSQKNKVLMGKTMAF